MLKPTAKHCEIFGLARLTLMCLACFCAGMANGQDLPAAADGRHLWLLSPSEADGDDQQPVIQPYHDPNASNDRYISEIEPIEGQLMPRGIAAGEDQLVLVLSDGRVLRTRPSISALSGAWDYTTTELKPLPEGVSLRSVAVTESGVWALVRVESEKTLEALDESQNPRRPMEGPNSFRFKSMLGLPPGVDLSKPDTDASDDQAPSESQDPEAETDSEGAESDPQAETEAPTKQSGDAEAEASDPQPQAEAEAAPQDAAAEELGQEPLQTDGPFEPTYRLIQLKRMKWVSFPLPEGFGDPHIAKLLPRPGEARPTIVSQPDSNPALPLQVFHWIDEPSEDQKPAGHWATDSYRVFALRNWDAAIVDDAVVLGVQRNRSEVGVDVELLVLRNGRVNRVTQMMVPTDGLAQWRLLSLAGQAEVVAMPGPKMQPMPDGTPVPSAFAGIRQSDLSGHVDPQVRPILIRQPTPLQQNADWIIQIFTYLTALALMMVFWKRSPGNGQINLPDNIEIAGLDKRIISGVLDLMPGFILASAIFDVSWLEIIMLWPGTPTPKTFAAMRPGLVVIGVTVGLATIMELITARSLGKWLTGIYVADFKGTPAPPIPSTVRAALRLLDMIALLLLIIPLISPARQRLGDILARTIVVNRLPDPEEERKKKEQRERERQDEDW